MFDREKKEENLICVLRRIFKGKRAHSSGKKLKKNLFTDMNK